MLRRSLPFILVAALLLAACGAAATPFHPSAGEPEFLPPAATAAPAAIEAPAASGGRLDESGVAQADRIVIKNASLSLIVKDATAATDEITGLAEGMGGFVVSTNVFETTFGPNQAPAKQASVTIRVPAARLNEALARIKAMAVEVQTENISGQDVTSEYTDLQSRLRNLEAAERQLQSIMDRATRTEDVLAVYNQLVSVREQIEVIKGQIKYYEQSAAFSQVSIELIPDVAAQPIEIGGWRPAGVVKQAFELLIRSLQALVNVLIYLGICGIPFALLLVWPTWAVVRGLRRRRQRAKQAAAKAAEPEAAG